MSDLDDLQKSLYELEGHLKKRIRERTGKPELTLREELEQQWLRIAERAKWEKLWMLFPGPRTMGICNSLARLDNFVTDWGIYTDISNDEINALENSCFSIEDYQEIDEKIKSGVPICDIVESDGE